MYQKEERKRFQRDLERFNVQIPGTKRDLKENK